MSPLKNFDSNSRPTGDLGASFCYPDSTPYWSLLVPLLPWTILANAQNGFPIIAKQSHPTTKPKPAFFVLKSALDRI
jgi:hypothetical protein